MSNLDGRITDWTWGDAREVPRTVVISDIDPDTLAKAWLTVKENLTDVDAAAKFQKTITSTLSEHGQIDEIGVHATSTPAHLFFLVSEANTKTLTPDVWYYYSIKVLSSTGAPRTLEDGKVKVGYQVTTADS